MLDKRIRNIYSFLFLFLLSFIYPDSSTNQNNNYKKIAVVVNLLDTVDVENSCIRLSDPTIKCETNNLNINNYHEFDIKNNQLILKDDYKKKIISAINRISNNFKINDNLDIFLPSNMPKNSFEFINKNYFQKKINQSKAIRDETNNYLERLSENFYSDYDFLIFVNFSYLEKKVNFYFFQIPKNTINLKRKYYDWLTFGEQSFFNNMLNLTYYYDVQNNMNFKYINEASNNFNREPGGFLAYKSIDLYSLYSFPVKSFKSINEEANKSFKYFSKDINNDKLLEYKVAGSEYIENEIIIYTKDGRQIRGNLLNYDEIFVVTDIDNRILSNGRKFNRPQHLRGSDLEYSKWFYILSDKFINSKENLTLMSVEGILYNFNYEDIRFIINYDNELLNLQSNEFVQNHSKYGKTEFVYKIGYMLDVQKNDYLLENFPLRYIIEKRIFTKDEVDVKVFDLTYLDNPGEFNIPYFWVISEFDEGDYRNLYLDRVLKFNLIENGNLLIEFQDIDYYYFLEINDKHNRLNWSYKINRWDSGRGCLDSPYLKLGYIYLGSDCNDNKECKHELLQISGPPDYYKNRLEEKYPELLFNRNIKFNTRRNSKFTRYKVEDKNMYNYDVGLFFSTNKTLIYTISNDGEITGYYNAILESEIVKNQISLYDIASKFGYTPYQARRVNRYFLKDKKLSSYRVHEYIDNNSYTSSFLGDNYFGVDIESELKIISNKYDIANKIKKNKYQINIPEYQIINFLKGNYIYKEQIIYFYKKGKQYIPRDGQYNYVDTKGNIRFNIELRNFSPVYPANYIIKNHHNKVILEDYEDSLFIVRDYESSEKIQEYKYIIDKHTQECYCNKEDRLHNECSGYKKIVESFEIDKVKLNKYEPVCRELVLFKNANLNFNNIDYKVEKKINEKIVFKKYYYANNNIAATFEYVNSAVNKMTGYHMNGSLWFIDNKIVPNLDNKKKYSKSQYYISRRPHVSYVKNLEFPFISYISYYENGDPSDILEYYSPYKFKEIKKDSIGNIIEYKDSLKYMKYHENGTLISDLNFNPTHLKSTDSTFVIEWGNYYDSKGNKTKEFILIKDPAKNNSNSKQIIPTILRFRTYNNGFLSQDYRFIDLDKEYRYHYKTNQIGEEINNYFNSNGENNEPCLSLKKYNEDGIIISDIAKEYVGGECIYVKYKTFHNNGEDREYINFKNNTYVEYDQNSNIIISGSPSRKNTFPYDLNIQNFNKLDKFEEYIEYFDNEKNAHMPYKTTYKYNTINKRWIMKTYDKDNQYLDFYTFADSSCMEYVYGSNNIYNVIDNDYCDYVRKESNYQRNTRYLLEVADTNRYNRYNFKPIINQGKRSHSIYHILTNAYEYWIVGKDTNMVEYEYYMLSDNKVSQYEIYEMHRKYRKSLKTYKNNELNGSYIEYYPYNDRFSSNNQLNRQDRLDPNNRIKFKTNYFHGILEGEYYSFYYNQTVKNHGYYSNNRKDGEWKFYYSNGAIESINMFEHGILKESRKYNMDGYEVCVTYYD